MMINLKFIPSVCCYFSDPLTKGNKVAVSDADSGTIHIVDLTQELKPTITIKIHF